MKHNSLGLGDIHRLANWEYASAAARLAATGFTADDVGKIAKQTDTGSFWELTAVTPTWVQMGGGSNISADVTISAETSDEIELAVQLVDSSGNDITSGNHALYMFFSDDDTVINFSVDPPEGLSVGAAGTFNEIVADTYFLAFFDNGEFWITVEETGAKTWYLVVILPGGEYIVSSAITFTV
jgi:hypothetical protein